MFVFYSTEFKSYSQSVDLSQEKIGNNMQVSQKRLASEVQMTCERQQLQEDHHRGGEDASHQVLLE